MMDRDDVMYTGVLKDLVKAIEDYLREIRES